MKTKIERVDDIPLLIAKMEETGLSNLLNQHYGNHGNGRNLDIGKTTTGFLSFVLSHGDHRLSHVESWASERIETLRYCLGNKDIEGKDFTDDRLGNFLEKYANDEKWMAFENAHNECLINVYNLNKGREAIRLDAMISQSYREASGSFEYGHAKQHRSDLPQLKTMVAMLDPLAMPLFSVTVSGNTADDVLYLPVIKQCEVLKLENQLFVGDSKMSNLSTRHYLQSKGHYYLTPLSKKQCNEGQIKEYLSKQPSELTMVYGAIKDGDKADKDLKAKVFELNESIEVTTEGTKAVWNERRIVVYSPSYGQAQQTAFINRINTSQKELISVLNTKQGKKQLKTLSEVQDAVNDILKRHKVEDFIAVKINEEVSTKTVRGYKNRPSQDISSSTFTLAFEVDELKQQEHIAQLGWRVYGCNAPIEALTTEQAVICYRNEYKIEHKFDELMNRITALLPIFLQKEERIKSLIRLLLVALKFVSLIQHQVRSELEEKQQTVKGLYAGNPSRKTNKPTTNLILRAFQNIHLNIVSINGATHVSMSKLNATQLQLIDLLRLPPDIYSSMTKLSFSQSDFSET